MKKSQFIFIIIIILTNAFQHTRAFSQTINDSLSLKIDALFKPWDSDKTPGCIVGIVQNGKVIFEKAYGMADIDNNRPLTAETKFNIASVSKQFTCMAIMLLQEQGKLNIGDEIHKYLPELPDYKEPVTIKQLMNHTSGVMEYFVLGHLYDQPISEDKLTFDDAFNSIIKYQYLSFKPVEQFFYCNSNFVLLAKIIERVSKRSFPIFIKDNIFQPLKMTESFVINNIDNYSEVAPEYIMPERNKKVYRPFNTSGTVYGGSCVVSTMKDMYKWADNFYNNKLGKANPQLIERMKIPGILGNGDTTQYGFGFMALRYRGTMFYYHGGSTGCSVLHIPSQNTSIIVLGNNGVERIPEQHIYDISDIILGNRLLNYQNPFATDKKSIEKNSSIYATDELKTFEGIYYDYFNNDNFQIIYNKGKLYFFGMELLPLQKNHFTMGGKRVAEIIFHDTTHMSVNSYTWEKRDYSYPIMKLECVKVNDQLLSEVLFKKLTGKYVVRGFDKVFELSPKEGKINMSQWNLDFKPVCENTYFSAPFSLHFIYDNRSEIIGFALSSLKFNKLRFDKMID
jgi:CubicO group peptidase (beta-lactamase class C family)